jgi:fatty acid CoA ligase FadD9
MKALPDNQRKSSLLPLMNAYAKPGQPTHGTGIPAYRPKSSAQQCNPQGSAVPGMCRT